MEYKIEAWEEMGGYIYVEAETVDEAKQKAEKHLYEHGMNGENVDVTHRESHVHIVTDK